VVQEPADGYWSNVWLKKPFCAAYWGGRPTEDWMFSTAYKAGAPWNDSQWDDPEFQELLKKGRSELDSEKRREIYYRMQEILRNAPDSRGASSFRLSCRQALQTRPDAPI